jgi:uncharacterized protein YecE (DUF72 family)
MNFYLGCPIWSFKGWVGNFYPQGTKPADFLFEYARRLTAIEGNTTFYAVPAAKTLEQWAQATPETFRFCAKVPKAISHEGRLADQTERAAEFVRAMQRLGPRLGPMFLQLPPRYSPALLGDLKAFLQAWPSEVRLGVEVRHPDWFESPAHNSLNELLSDQAMARVVIDTRPIRSLDGEEILEGSVYQTLLAARLRKPNVPVLPEPTTDFVFIRYIGHPNLEINAPFLDEWAGFIDSQLRLGADAYVICHSPENLTAPYLCRVLHRRVAQSLPLPPLPWDQVDSAGQERLL